jgi:hypothetical protein
MTEKKEEQKYDPVITRVLAERSQQHATRKSLFNKLEEELQRPVVAYFTSFRYPVAVDDSDADMLEGLLQAMDLSKGLALVISSPGGDGVAAERIIKICKSYSGTGEFFAIVPGKAKSAATMICLGASRIYMGPASELGPVDPQIIVMNDNNIPTYLSACHVVDSFNNLFEKAVKEKGRLEPYLQQLAKYDASIIAHYNSMIALSKDISIKALHSGMMSNFNETQIEEKIKVFLTPAETKTHGRPIFRDIASNTGLKIENIDTKGDMGHSIYELYIRAKFFADSGVSKLIESKVDSAYVQPPQERRHET